MKIEIEVPSSALSRLFESDKISSETLHKIPGGATIQLGRGDQEWRWYSSGVERLIPIVITIGSGIVADLAAKYLWEKLKDEPNSRIRINREERIEITPGAITKVFKETIELQGKSSKRPKRPR